MGDGSRMNRTGISSQEREALSKIPQVIITTAENVLDAFISKYFQKNKFNCSYNFFSKKSYPQR